jgi:hypothetical protein
VPKYEIDAIRGLVSAAQANAGGVGQIADGLPKDLDQNAFGGMRASKDLSGGVGGFIGSMSDPFAHGEMLLNKVAKGTPSKGLMQCIDPTFQAHKLPGHGDIYNPVDNIIAGVRYTFDRYGGFEGHPGLKSMAGGGGYQGY